MNKIKIKDCPQIIRDLFGFHSVYFSKSRNPMVATELNKLKRRLIDSIANEPWATIYRKELRENIRKIEHFLLHNNTDFSELKAKSKIKLNTHYLQIQNNLKYKENEIKEQVKTYIENKIKNNKNMQTEGTEYFPDFYDTYKDLDWLKNEFRLIFENTRDRTIESIANLYITVPCYQNKNTGEDLKIYLHELSKWVDISFKSEVEFYYE